MIGQMSPLGKAARIEIFLVVPVTEGDEEINILGHETEAVVT